MSRAELIATLFEQADELPAGERAAFLDARTAGDASLRAELERLLQASAMAEERDSQWEAGAIANLPAAPEPADAFVAHGGFERYRLLDRIGAGGMGAVYKAVRAGHGIEQIVAVKILHTVARDAATTMRFEQERRILARLEHPNIARMLDGGVTPDGRLFLVMEYVEGVPLSDWAAARKPDVTEVLRLFGGICAAVSHTHRNLVVHRDLKPGNVLVTADGVPKLVDFGIATLFDGSAMKTRTGAGALTPEYASPEQIRGEPTGTASDIYSLGVLLYQMLAGQLPYKAESGPMALARAITLDQPVPLRARGVRIASDLELIVLKALRKEPERRYPSVEQFPGRSGTLAERLSGFSAAGYDRLPCHQAGAPESGLDRRVAAGAGLDRDRFGNRGSRSQPPGPRDPQIRGGADF